MKAPSPLIVNLQHSFQNVKSVDSLETLAMASPLASVGIGEGGSPNNTKDQGAYTGSELLEGKVGCHSASSSSSYFMRHPREAGEVDVGGSGLRGFLEPLKAIEAIPRGKTCWLPWGSLSPLVQEAIRLGWEIRSISAQSKEYAQDKRPLPVGHRFFHDCLREQEARVLEWLIRKYKDNCWFFTATFKDYLHPDKADRMLSSFLARISQAHKAIPGAALLKSIYTTEWQQRDVIHYHLLIFGNRLGSLSRKRWEFRWQMISGGFAADYDAELKAAPYLVKHQIKDRPGGNLHLGGAWRGIKPPRSVSCHSSASNGSRGVATAFCQANIATALENSRQARPG
jgi:hypothetical protein